MWIEFLLSYFKKKNKFQVVIPFPFAGMLFLTISFLWKWTEKGRVRNLSDGFRGKALPLEKAHQETEHIAQNIEDYESANKTYPYLYVFCEFLSFAACVASFCYYASLLNLLGMDTLNNYTDFLMHDYLRHPDSHLMKLFPRMVICPRSDVQINCRINYNQLNEMLHIVALLLTGIVLILYVINFIFIVWIFTNIQDYAHPKHISKKQLAQLKTLPFGKRLILLLLHSNMDKVAHMILMKKMANQTYISTSTINTHITNTTNTQTLTSNKRKKWSITSSDFIQMEGRENINTTQHQKNNNTQNINDTYTDNTTRERPLSLTFSEYMQMEASNIDRLLGTTPSHQSSQYSIDYEEP
jgi:Innexin